MSKAEIVRLEVERVEAGGRKVIVICGSDARALSALAGTGGLVTVFIDKVEEMEESRDWTEWKDEETQGVRNRYRSEVMAEDFNGCLRVRNEGDSVSDAKRRKAWQTCYGPAQRCGVNKNSWRGRNYRKGYIGQ